ncbi:MAG TPA: hypothetical protein VFL65_07925 [Jatrophihabitans sp.]|nr:hypothetical protein [Jatrophihabitans sp.]
MLVAAEVVAKSGEALKAGPLAFAVILVLCIACYFLFKSMSKHLRKVRENPPPEVPAPHPPHRQRPRKVIRPVPLNKDQSPPE